MQRERHRQVLRRRPKGIIERQAVGLIFQRGRPDHRAPEPQLPAALQLPSPAFDVKEWDQRQPGKLLWSIAAKLGQPVVIRSKTGLLKRRLLYAEEDKTNGGLQH